MNKIIQRFNGYISTDNNVLDNVISRLINYYTPLGGNNTDIPKEKQLQLQDNTNGFGPVFDKFKRNFHCNIPFIDTEIWEIFKSRAGSENPTEIKCGDVPFIQQSELCERTSRISKGFAREVENQDRICWQSYTVRSRHLHASKRYKIARAGIQSARELSIISDSYGRENTFKGRIEECVMAMSKNTNSGYPFFKRKNDKKCIDDTISWMNNITENSNYYSVFKNPIILNPSTIFHRVQPSVDNENKTAEIKIRQVWGEPQRIVCLEYYFFGNIVKRVFTNIKNSIQPIYSTGLSNYEISQKIISKFRIKLLNNELNQVYSIDYSKYDRTIPTEAIDLFFAICSESLKLEENEYKLFNILRLYLKHTPFIYKDRLHFKMKGISSGSYITNLFDTWWNITLFILASSIRESKNLDVNNLENDDFFDNIFHELRINDNICRNLSTCGDDALVYCDSLLISIHRIICLNIGMNVSVKNVTYDYNDDIFFLGRFWNEFNEPFQSELYMITHIILRTKWYDKHSVDFDISSELTLNRILSICLPLSNGKTFLDKYFYDYIPYYEFINSNKDFTLLKEWPNEGYITINSSKALQWENL